MSGVRTAGTGFLIGDVNIKDRVRKFAATRFGRIVHDIVETFFETHIMRNSAALAYFLIMSIFPLLLCIVAILGNLNLQQRELFSILFDFIPEAAAKVINEFLAYVSGNMSKIMMVLGITSMITTSAAALRVIMGVIGDVQGEKRFQGLFGHFMSFLLSLGFLASVYLSGLVIMTGEWFHTFLQDIFKTWDMSSAWLWIRFLILFAIMFSILLMIYVVSAPKKTKIRERVIGAVSAGVLMVVVSAIFSRIISTSARYTVVYGSLASIIILMVWMYACSIIILMCNVLSVAIARNK